jgi:hypothetical protein
MSATMLSLVQQATGEMGLTVPTAVASSTAADQVQQLALLNAVGNELAREHDWQAMTVEYQFNTPTYTYTGTATNTSTTLSAMSSVVGLTTDFQLTGTGIPQNTYVSSVGANSVVMSNSANANSTGSYVFSQTRFSLPSAYDRLIDRTDWDKTQHWEMLGPETMQQVAWLKSGFISTGPRVRYYLIGNQLNIWPPLGANHLLGFDYVTANWIYATGSTVLSKQLFTVDTDTCIFPDRLMVLGLKLKYFQTKGFDTTALYLDYCSQKDIAKANDGGSQTLSMAPRINSVLVGWNNIPDSGYGS